jgi:hypothetical protein
VPPRREARFTPGLIVLLVVVAVICLTMIVYAARHRANLPEGCRFAGRARICSPSPSTPAPPDSVAPTDDFGYGPDYDG